MLTYIVDGDYYSISPEEQEGFLEKYPNAQLVSDDENQQQQLEQNVDIDVSQDITTPIAPTSDPSILAPPQTEKVEKPKEKITPLSIFGDNIKDF